MPSPRLWIVATPIGNLDDLSPRARSVLQTADLILAEDTRKAALLFGKCGIKPQHLLSFFEHNEDSRQAEALAALEAGQEIALITDAGTPLLSDPGYKLTRECRKRGIPVSPVPGPSAPIAALSASGLPPVPFTFLGFLPRSSSARKELFGNFAKIPGSLVFFERKNRLGESLADALEILGERELAICRELTKTHEEFIIGSLSQAANLTQDLLGELTIIIGPPEKSGRDSPELVRSLLLAALSGGLKPKEAARQVRQRVSGWSASDLYGLIEDLKKI